MVLCCEDNHRKFSSWAQWAFVYSALESNLGATGEEFFVNMRSQGVLPQGGGREYPVLLFAAGLGWAG